MLARRSSCRKAQFSSMSKSTLVFTVFFSLSCSGYSLGALELQHLHTHQRSNFKAKLSIRFSIILHHLLLKGLLSQSFLKHSMTDNGIPNYKSTLVNR